MFKDEIHARFSKGRWHDKMRAFKYRTSTMYETKNGASKEETEVMPKKVGVAAQGNIDSRDAQMEEGRIHDQHEFRRVASITTRGGSRWLTEETKRNLLKCGRQEELLWATVNQEGLETNIATVGKQKVPLPQQGLP